MSPDTTIISRQGRRKIGELYECTHCHRFLPPTEFRALAKVRCGLAPNCNECEGHRGKAYRRTHRQQTKARYTRWYAKNRDRLLANAKEYLRELRRGVVAGYGGKCECCGETMIEFLCIDHRHGDGRADREQGLAGRAMCLHLIRNGFPRDRYRLLCHNCNMARGLYGYCPHQKGGV